jgi:hydrogenase/urease accessory protein HupE
MKRTTRLLSTLILLVTLASALSHPIPDIPVRGYFSSDGSAIIRVEVDTRCFAEEPVQEPYLQNWVLKEMKDSEKKTLQGKARDYVRDHIRFRFAPLSINPDFEYSFTTFDNKPLTKIDDPVMITGEWRTKVPKGIEGYQIESLKSGTIDVQFLNFIDGQAMERINVLFPGETSFLLDLSDLSSKEAARPAKGSVNIHDTSGGRLETLWQFLRKGFTHVLPFGLDHVLFVLGLFFLSREWRPLLYQVTMFTAAHTITLALATMGTVRVSAAVVEPIIAASIAFVALENIYRARYTHWRLLVVFAFGLVHGLGFAGVLMEYELPPTSLIIGLIGFNVGVEFGQLAVISIAFGLTAWLKDAEKYRRYVVVPASVAIAALGVYWTIERAMFTEKAAEAPAEQPIAASVEPALAGSTL